MSYKDTNDTWCFTVDSFLPGVLTVLFSETFSRGSILVTLVPVFNTLVVKTLRFLISFRTLLDS